MPSRAKCPRCLHLVDFPVLIRGEIGPAWAQCHECDLRTIIDTTGVDPTGTAAAAQFARHARFPGYTLLGVLAVGGMGFLYSAIRDQTLQLCALKTVPPEFTGYRSLLQRFRREAYAMRALRHPGFMPLLEEFRDHTPPFFSMPFIAGRTLRLLIEESAPLPLDEVSAIVSQLGDALHHVHQSGFVHRDVKPSNVLLSARGDVVLFDFGVVQESANHGDLTDEGMALGTPAYNAPETFERCETSVLSDQYSFAVIIYQMLTGHLPMGVFAAPTGFSINLPEESEQALLKALAHDAHERHESVKHFYRAFLRPMLVQTSGSDTHRNLITRLAEPSEEMLLVEPGYEAFPVNESRDLGVSWLLKKLTGGK